MRNPYYYLYFRIYKFAKKVSAWESTWLAMVWITGLNFFNVAVIIFWIFPADKLPLFSPWYISLIITFPLMFLNYFIFIHKDRSLKIIAEYENESKKQKFWSSFVTIIYVMLTLYLAHLK